MRVEVRERHEVRWKWVRGGGKVHGKRGMVRRRVRENRQLMGMNERRGKESKRRIVGKER